MTKVPYQVSDFEGLSFTIHRVALDIAEEFCTYAAQGNSRVIVMWGNAFHSDKVTQYVKKAVSSWAWGLIRSYFWLAKQSDTKSETVHLVVADTPMSHLVLRYLSENYPHPGLRVLGDKSRVWKFIQYSIQLMTKIAGHFARVLLIILKRGVRFRSDISYYGVSKEILWGLGVSRRSDDFFVDERLIRNKRMLFYYGRSPKDRVSSTVLNRSIECALSRGYTCLDFGAVPLPGSMFLKVLPFRYLLVPILLGFIGAVSQFRDKRETLLSLLGIGFLFPSLKWEIFLSTHRPEINISQDDPLPDHIVETIVLNLYGLKNSGFQWADDTQWRAVSTAYLTYDVYFSWGPMSQKFWKDNWAISKYVFTGYLWGRYCSDSMQEVRQLRESLLGPNHCNSYVLALFDENPSPDVYTSADMLHDFYYVGVDILDNRSDVVVVASPKRKEGLTEFARVKDLIDPYLRSGRINVWDKEKADLWQVIAISDVVISMMMGVPYLEAICCGKTGFNYAPSKNKESPVYANGRGAFVFDEESDISNAIKRALNDPTDNGLGSMEMILTEVDPYMDSLSLERMTSSLFDIINNE